MSIGDSLNNNGDYTITNLKSATGIADDRLSAHHPDGAGNETAMGDFACKAVGNFNNLGEKRRLLPCVLYDDQGVGGSYNSNYDFVFNTGDGPIRPGIPFEIFIEAYDGGDLGKFFVEQILQDGGLVIDNDLTSSDVNILNITKNKPAGVNRPGVVIKAEVTSLVNPLVVAVEYVDPLNTNAGNIGKESISNFTKNVGLAFRTQDVGVAQTLITGVVIRLTYRNSLPNAGSSGWEVEIEPQPPYNGPEVFDPADKATNDVFEAYDKSPTSNSSFASNANGEFLPTNHPLELELQETKFPTTSTKDFWIELDNDSGGVWDMVRCRLDRETSTTDDWPTTDGAKEAYSFQTNEIRRSGTISNPYNMSRSNATA